jgi:hypothetical protein
VLSLLAPVGKAVGEAFPTAAGPCSGGLAGDGLCGPGQLELLDRAFHHLSCGFAAGRLFRGALPGRLGLLWGEANQRAELILVLGFPPRAICAEIPKQLSRGDQLIKPLPITSSHTHKSAWSFLAQEGTEVGFQCAGLLEQDVVSCFVADQFQQLAHGSADQQPPFRFRRPDRRAAGLRLGS